MLLNIIDFDLHSLRMPCPLCFHVLRFLWYSRRIRDPDSKRWASKGCFVCFLGPGWHLLYILIVESLISSLKMKVCAWRIECGSRSRVTLGWLSLYLLWLFSGCYHHRFGKYLVLTYWTLSEINQKSSLLSPLSSSLFPFPVCIFFFLCPSKAMILTVQVIILGLDKKTECQVNQQRDNFFTRQYSWLTW